MWWRAHPARCFGETRQQRQSKSTIQYVNIDNKWVISLWIPLLTVCVSSENLFLLGVIWSQVNQTGHLSCFCPQSYYFIHEPKNVQEAKCRLTRKSRACLLQWSLKWSKVLVRTEHRVMLVVVGSARHRLLHSFFTISGSFMCFAAIRWLLMCYLVTAAGPSGALTT